MPSRGAPKPLAPVKEEPRWYAVQHETPAKTPMLIDIAVKPLHAERPDFVRLGEHCFFRDLAVEALKTPEKDNGQLVSRRLQTGIERLGAQFLHVENGKRGGVDWDIGHESYGFSLNDYFGAATVTSAGRSTRSAIT